MKEVSNKVIFLRKLVPGGSEHSFGIHVAKMAGMPKSIVKRSNEILKQLETDNRQEGIDGKEKVNSQGDFRCCRRLPVEFLPIGRPRIKPGSR